MATTLSTRLQDALIFVAENPRPSISTREHYLAASSRPIVSTGYYGRIKGVNTQVVSKVHARLAGERKPLCGANLHEDMAWHWCASRAEKSYIECKGCHAALPRLSEALGAHASKHIGQLI